jgi:hypothetical protein
MCTYQEESACALACVPAAFALLAHRHVHASTYRGLFGCFACSGYVQQFAALYRLQIGNLLFYQRHVDSLALGVSCDGSLERWQAHLCFRIVSLVCSSRSRGNSIFYVNEAGQMKKPITDIYVVRAHFRDSLSYMAYHRSGYG